MRQCEAADELVLRRVGWQIATMRMLRFTCLVGWLAIASCDRQTAAAVATGAGVFERHCSICHGPAGKPPASMVARFGVRDLTASEFRSRVTPGLVEQQVRAGSANKL